MENKTQPSGSSPPPKPWERAGSSSGPAPFKAPSAGSTSDVVEASGTARPGEVVSAADRNTTVNRNTLGRPVPARPWEQQTYGSTLGGFNAHIRLGNLESNKCLNRMIVHKKINQKYFLKTRASNSFLCFSAYLPKFRM
ncbi:peroxisomal membrane 13, partial [Olea europaea subsp. europaea]